jgi:hypothetical protein
MAVKKVTVSSFETRVALYHFDKKLCSEASRMEEVHVHRVQSYLKAILVTSCIGWFFETCIDIRGNLKMAASKEAEQINVKFHSYVSNRL